MRNNLSHGHTRGPRGASRMSPTYNSWRHMIERCGNPNARNYKFYGGRGITVCARWRDSFVNFLADVGERPQGTMIERINGELGYFPSNVRWATMGEQCRNRRSNVMLTFNGQTMCMNDWSQKIGINRLTLFNRLKNGMSVSDALTAPIVNRGQEKRRATLASKAKQYASNS